jgi:hypothetical protein
VDVDIELEISPGTAPGEYAVRVVQAPLAVILRACLIWTWTRY